MVRMIKHLFSKILLAPRYAGQKETKLIKEQTCPEVITSENYY
jgi:hypothetical protein